MCKKNWLSSLLLSPRKNLPTVAVSVFAGVSRWLLQMITVMKPEFSKTILLNGDRSLQHLFLYLPWWKSSYLIYSSFIAKICLLHALKLTVLLRERRWGVHAGRKLYLLLATAFQCGYNINTKEWLLSATAYHKSKNCNQSLRFCFPTIQAQIIIEKILYCLQHCLVNGSADIVCSYILN